MTGTYNDWHPGELDTLGAAIDRVREDYGMSNDTRWATREWWHGGGRYAGDELATHERRAEERGRAVEEYHMERSTIRVASAPLGITPNRAKYRIIHCAQCGDEVVARTANRRFCSVRCERASRKGKAA